MKDTSANLQDIASEWHDARQVYSVYSAILKSADVGLDPCKALESPVNRSDEETLAAVRTWLAAADEKTTAAQIRQVIQHSSLGTEACLRALLQRYLSKSNKTDEDRNKLDFLVVQYFAATAPRSMALGRIEIDDVGYVLEPVLGKIAGGVPSELEPLEALLGRINGCTSLGDLIRECVVEAGRKIKDEAGKTYLDPTAMVAFARYNFLLRRAFVQLLHNDLEMIRACVRELEACGVNAVNCSEAGFGATEPLADLRRYCRTWRNSFVADYAAGPAFRSIAQVREAVEQAVRAIRNERKAAAAQAAAASQSTPVSTERTKAMARAEAPEQPPAASDAEKGPALRTMSSEVAAIEDARARVNAAVQHAAASIDKAMPFEEEQATDLIGKQLAANLAGKSAASATVKLGTTLIVLSSWELNAFLKPAEALSPVLQRAVVARSILMEAMERSKNGKSELDLAPALELAQTVAGELQVKIAEARKERNLDGAVSMAATSKRLSSVAEQAEKLVAVAK